MRATFNRAGKTAYANSIEQIGSDRGALVPFDFRLPSPTAILGVTPDEAGAADRAWTAANLWGGFRAEAAWSQLDTASAGDSGLPDNYQPVESAWYLPGPTALIDVYTPAPNTTGALVVNDPNHVIAACDTPGDKDWFAVTLTAGVTYEFGQYAYVGGIPGVEGNGLPLADAYLEIYDSAGNLLSIADGGGPNTPQGLDALMTFQATYSGTYYVNATSYDNTGDGVGDFAGDYEIFARTATGTTYTTHYDISSPLHSIDWGGVLVNREHVAVRNPDGMEGPRPTGEPAADPATVEGNALGHPGKNIIYLYFAGEGDLYANADSTIPGQVVVQNPYQYEIQAMLNAANEFSKVADVVFVSNYTLNTTTHLYERDESIEYKPGPLGPEAGVKYATGVAGDGFDADFFYFSYPGTPGPGISLLGSMSPPDYGDEGVAQFNSADERWSAQMLQPGGFSFVTLIHEFGHGMGLAHPHDTGGGSSVMHGVQTNGVPGDDGGAGDFDLNQGVNTMMSYNDGWEKSPYGQAETNNEGYGWLGSLMALDIAVIQDKYGVNEDWATGNNTYVLKDVNEWGVYIDAATGQPAVHDATNQATARDGYYQGQSTYYSSIWDAGGVDQIVYSGARNTNIDLRAATLRYEYGGAGWMSYATGIYGGFTIANGVTIENAVSGSGNDVLIGNAVANILDGGGGADDMSGGRDNDTYLVDNGSDIVRELAGEGSDLVYTSASYALALGQEVETLSTRAHAGTETINLIGNEFAQTLYGNAGANYLNGNGGADVMAGFAGDDLYVVDNIGDQVLDGFGQGNDSIFTSVSYVLSSNQEIETLSTQTHAGTDDLFLTGNQYNNTLIGNAGDNILNGVDGADVMIGLAGDDTYAIDNLGDLVIDGVDQGNDLVLTYLSHTLTNGNQIETLSTVFHEATTAINLGGNDYNNKLIGNYGANYLNGNGGVDVMIGLYGDDLYVVDNAGDLVEEVANGGADSLYSFASYALAAGQEVETISTAVQGGTAAINLTGNGYAQTVIGNYGANLLNGGGGNDVLYGLYGADTFAFTTALGAGNVDTIGDFAAGSDKIGLDDAIFTAIGASLNASAFVIGTAAGDADDRIIYNSTTGALFYDADGNGAGAAVQFATLSPGLALAASDFAVI
ncbi:MAG TPA: M10 family metallopeptidase C-terminal domain-containing protein [Allosphingosinicella sp.]|nr:M10 family metallopeptidase C-terminal domain-containing protein [Allosphingosinicella sp.]